MKKTYYFPHDYHARHDRKLVKVRKDYGILGYGLYWFIVEVLYETGDSYPFAALDVIAFESGISEDVIKQIVTEYDLFSFDDEVFWSESQRDRIAKMSEIHEKRKRAGSLGGKAKSTNQAISQFDDDYYKVDLEKK